MGSAKSGHNLATKPPPQNYLRISVAEPRCYGKILMTFLTNSVETCSSLKQYRWILFPGGSMPKPYSALRWGVLNTEVRITPSSAKVPEDHERLVCCQWSPSVLQSLEEIEAR